MRNRIGLMMIVGVMVAASSLETRAGWQTGYQFRKAITIDADAVSGASDHTDFPVLVSVTDADLATTGNGGDVENGNGYDIVFTGSDGSTALDHEVESYTAANGTVIAWIRISTLDYDDDTTIYVYYGNGDISTSQENVAGAWNSDYVGVWHLKETPDANAADSSGNGNNGNTTPMESGDQVAGKVDGCLDFGVGEYESVNIGSAASIDNLSGGGMTVEAWVKPDNLTINPNILTKTQWRFFFAGTPRQFRFARAWSGSNPYWVAQTDDVTTDWQHVAATYHSGSTSSNAAIYVNGVSQGIWEGAAPSGSATDDSAETLYISRPTSVSWEGKLDEVRVSSTLRSADWIATCHTNQVSPSTFYAVGTEENRGGTIFAF